LFAIGVVITYGWWAAREVRGQVRRAAFKNERGIAEGIERWWFIVRHVDGRVDFDGMQY
jgi:hypothetical protein